jgi:hypothetical protein
MVGNNSYSLFVSFFAVGGGCGGACTLSSVLVDAVALELADL